MKEIVRNQPLEIKVVLKEYEKEQGVPNLAAYIYSRSGRLILKTPLKADSKMPGIATGAIKTATKLDNLVIKIGPDVSNPALLDKQSPFTETITLSRVDNLVFEIDKIRWECWLKYAYLVKGTVSKVGNTPICAGEVEIYDVDVKYCFLRIPDIQLERIRDAIIDVITDPPPIDIPEYEIVKPEVWWNDEDDDFCGTGPKGPFPPKIDILSKLELLPQKWNFAKSRYQNLSGSASRMNKSLDSMLAAQKREFLDTEFIEGVKVSQILYSNTTQFRKLLIDKFVTIRYWLCWYPWIYWLWWPYCGYSLEHLGTAVLKSDGSFDTLLWLSVCRKDIPDLWFKVKQNINGVEKVIYARYPVPCNTYWNHASNDPVHLIVTDPNAVACHQNSHEGDFAYVLPMGIYEDEWYQVENAHLNANVNPAVALPTNCGLYDATDPYGTRLDLRMEFHEDVYNNGVRFYKWSFRKHGNVEWMPIDTPISHRHIKKVSPGKHSIEAYGMGPKNVGANTDLFEVPDPDLAWLSNRNDLAYAIWETDTDSRVTDGKYDLKLEMFNGAGNKIAPSANTFGFALPVENTGELNSTLHIQDDSLIMHLHVNNKDTVSNIKAVKLNGTAAGDCQFLEYTNKEADRVSIEFEAYHKTLAENFMSKYQFGVKKGISASPVASHNSTIPAPPSLPKVLSYTVAELLGTSDRCAFTAWLHTYPRTRDGHGSIRAYESSDSSAFALTQIKICPKPIYVSEQEFTLPKDVLTNKLKS